MKKNALYTIDVMSNTVTVSKKFIEEVNMLEGENYDLYLKFKAMGFTIIQRTRKAPTSKKTTNNPLRSLKPVEDKLPLIPFAKMALYISMLDDADVMMDEFDAVRKAAQTQQHPRQYVNAWFRKEFPRYDEMPEFDENNHLVHNPNAA